MEHQLSLAASTLATRNCAALTTIPEILQKKHQEYSIRSYMSYGLLHATTVKRTCNRETKGRGLNSMSGFAACKVYEKMNRKKRK